MSHISGSYSFVGVGITALLESYSLVPEDSMRRYLSLSFNLMAQIMGEYAKKDTSLDVVVYQIAMATAALFAYSVHNPTDLVAGVGCYVLTLLNRTMLLTIMFLFYKSPISAKKFRDVLPEEKVNIPIFATELYTILIICIVIAAFFGKPKSGTCGKIGVSN